MLEHDVLRVKQIVDGQDAFTLSHALFGEQGGAGLFIHGEVGFRLQTAHNFIHLPVQASGFVSRSGDNQRSTRFVDENGVHFVHNGKVVPALHELFLVELHVVAQVVKTEFVVCAAEPCGPYKSPYYP